MRIKTKRKICFLALAAYPVISNTGEEMIGGSEVQQVLLAKELVRKGFEVSFIVGDFGQEKVGSLSTLQIKISC